MRPGSNLSLIIGRRIKTAYKSIVLWDYDDINTISSINLTNFFNHYYNAGMEVTVSDILFLIRQIQGGVTPQEFIRMNDTETSEVYRKLTRILEEAILDETAETKEDEE